MLKLALLLANLWVIKAHKGTWCVSSWPQAWWGAVCSCLRGSALPPPASSLAQERNSTEYPVTVWCHCKERSARMSLVLQAGSHLPTAVHIEIPCSNAKHLSDSWADSQSYHGKGTSITPLCVTVCCAMCHCDPWCCLRIHLQGNLTLKNHCHTTSVIYKKHSSERSTAQQTARTNLHRDISAIVGVCMCAWSWLLPQTCTIIL